MTETIRESGDRGTSILNYLTNLVAFLAARYLLCIERGWSETSAKKMVRDDLKDHLDTPDMIGEGDDSQHCCSTEPAFVDKNKATKPDATSFGKP